MILLYIVFSFKFHVTFQILTWIHEYYKGKTYRFIDFPKSAFSLFPNRRIVFFITSNYYCLFVKGISSHTFAYLDTYLCLSRHPELYIWGFFQNQGIHATCLFWLEFSNLLKFLVLIFPSLLQPLIFLIVWMVKVIA